MSDFPRLKSFLWTRASVASLALLLAACGNAPPLVTNDRQVSRAVAKPAGSSRAVNGKSQDVVIFALGLMETGYRFGGKNPEAGLDCSGMVSYVFDKAVNLRLSGSAADIGRKGRHVEKGDLVPGDLVFFNTRNLPKSHVGIYIGDGRFVHAPSTNGKVRTDSLSSGWYASRFEEGRSYLD